MMHATDKRAAVFGRRARRTKAAGAVAHLTNWATIAAPPYGGPHRGGTT
ncbi:hypothetical protein EKH55_1458 [Sinorhizobium alkalisoli]|nr:hypothetical protein EKH55_1458 [Sinorhizobium alkalisoli]